MRLATSNRLTTAEILRRIACLLSHGSNDSGDTAVYWLAYLAIGNSWLPSAGVNSSSRQPTKKTERRYATSENCSTCVDVVDKRSSSYPATANSSPVVWLSIARSPVEQVTVGDKRGWAIAERGGARTGKALSRQALTDAVALAQQLSLNGSLKNTRRRRVSIVCPLANFQYSHSQSLVNKAVIMVIIVRIITLKSSRYKSLSAWYICLIIIIEKLFPPYILVT